MHSGKQPHADDAEVQQPARLEPEIREAAAGSSYRACQSEKGAAVHAG
jgi:hypothetical protein